jgi:hypothetical protein
LIFMIKITRDKMQRWNFLHLSGKDFYNSPTQSQHAQVLWFTLFWFTFSLCVMIWKHSLCNVTA